MKQSTAGRETVLLGWDRPLLPAVVEELRQRYVVSDHWGLDGLLGVLPTARGVVRMEELLRWEATKAGLTVALPRLITIGELAALLGSAASPLARDIEQTLAWADVLRHAEPSELGELYTQLPETDAVGAWLEIAAGLRRLFADLAAQDLTVSDVLDACQSDRDRRRWQYLAQLDDRYCARLAAAGLSDPYVEFRRRPLPARDLHKRLLLIGTSDLSPWQIALLHRVDLEIIAFVAAPREEAWRFNEFGVVRPDVWLDREIALDDEHLLPAGDVADQAAAVAETLAEFAPSYATDQLTVGVTDPSQVAPIEVELRGCGVASFRQLGWVVSETSVGRLFKLLNAYLQRRSWEALAALVRQADVNAWVTQQLLASHDQADVSRTNSPAWMTQLDELIANHFPVRCDQPLSEKAQQAYPLATCVAELVDQSLQSFAGDERRPLADWSRAIKAWLESIESVGLPLQQERGLQRERGAQRKREALRSLGNLLDQLASLNNRLDFAVRGVVAIEVVLARMSEARVFESPSADEVEILGWLDLALDDAPALVVCGLNHPFVPEAVASHPYLPALLRTQLARRENDRRFARDAYTLQLLIKSRSAVRFIVGRRAADGSPTPPSRLLAAASPVDIARRMRMLLAQSRPQVRVVSCWDEGPAMTQLSIPVIAEPRQLSALSVTAFRDYLVCPYRFYLRHGLGIRPLDDAGTELAANQFGDLVHGAVEDFGRSDDRHARDADRIEQCLIEYLHEYARQRYGPWTSTAVKLQIAQAEKRLRTVALRQAERRAAGWQIHAVEAKVDEKPVDQQGNPKPKAGVIVDGEFMGLRGRFDRIDHHPEQNRWAILDYKTHGHKPEKKHLRSTPQGAQWIDLQLPLYRLMIPFLGIDAAPEDVELGYFNVSDKESETRINIARFTPEQFQAAEQLVHSCIRNIRSHCFEPTQDRVLYDDYAMILQTGVTQQLLKATLGETLA